MRNSATIVTKTLKWPVCLLLALLISLQALPVMATEQQTEQTQTPTVTEVTGSESAQKSEASGENNETITDGLEPIDLQEVATTSNSDWTTTKPHEGEVLNGGYVGFKNKESGKYLTIQNGTAASGINVCQQSASSIANAQEFYLQYTYLVTGSLANFTIYPINSSGSVATNLRVKAGTISEGSANVSLGTSSFIQTNERWQIEHVVDNYYCIYIADNPTSASVKYALTAHNGSDSATPTVGALDNVYVAEYTGHESQLWQICADGKPIDINGYDISIGGSQEVEMGSSVSYYYVPNTFDTSINWYTDFDNLATAGEFGIVTPIQYGEIIVSFEISNSAIYNYYFTSTLYSLPIAAENIYLSNVATGRYIDIYGPSTANDAIIQQSDFSTNSSKKWRVYHDDYSIGYIRLRSVYSAKYLAVDPNDNSIVEQTNAINDYSLWKLDCSTSGNILLICKATESSNLVLSVPLNQNSNGTSLTMLSYTDNNVYKDEWYIVSHVISYVNYYDSSVVGNSPIIQSISTANIFSNLVYARYFHVGLFMDGQANKYATKADQCTTGTNVDCSLTICGENCYRYHHKNVSAMIRRLYFSPRENDHIYILWTDRVDGTYCGVSMASGHTTFQNTLALVHISYRPIILFLTITDSLTEMPAYMSIILAHETMHSLKMEDVYDNDGHDKEGETACVMERYDSSTAYAFYLDVLAGIKMPFCDSCSEAVRTYTADIVINGNIEEES